MDELHQVVQSLSPHSAAGPNGYNGKFYRVCWNIIKMDLLNIVHAFFYGHEIPKYFSHAFLVLLSKSNNPNNFSELKPIRLSNCISKIFSKLLIMRLAHILPSLITNNQSGFVKGRNVLENIMLA